MDSRREAQDLDLQMAAALRAEGLPFVLVATKTDKCSRAELDASLNGLSRAFGVAPKRPVPFTVEDTVGAKAIWSAIRGGILGESSLLTWCLDNDDDDAEDEDSDDEGEESTESEKFYGGDDDENGATRPR